MAGSRIRSRRISSALRPFTSGSSVLADQEGGERARRVERAARLADLSRPRQRRRAAIGSRLVVEHVLVDRAQLLDVEIAVDDARAIVARPWTRRDRRRADRDDRLAHDRVGDRRAIERVGLRRREEPAVERGDAKLAGAAAGVRQPSRSPGRPATVRDTAARAAARSRWCRGCSGRDRPGATAAAVRALRQTAGTARGRAPSAIARTAPASARGRLPAASVPTSSASASSTPSPRTRHTCTPWRRDRSTARSMSGGSPAMASARSSVHSSCCVTGSWPETSSRTRGSRATRCAARRPA